MRGLIILITFAFIVSCGGGSGLDPDIEGELNSVIVYITPQQTYIQGDIITWLDTNNDQQCDTYLINSVIANFKIKVEPKPNLPESIPVSPVEIEKVQISFTPQTKTSPYIPETQRVLSITVEPNSEVEFSILLLSESIIYQMINELIEFPGEYYVSLTFSVREVYSGEKTQVLNGINLTVGDFYTNDEQCIK